VRYFFEKDIPPGQLSSCQSPEILTLDFYETIDKGFFF